MENIEEPGTGVVIIKLNNNYPPLRLYPVLYIPYNPKNVLIQNSIKYYNYYKDLITNDLSTITFLKDSNK